MWWCGARPGSPARLIADPYALDPDGARRGLDGLDHFLPAFDADFDAWVAPFVMAAINTRVVRRSNALLGYAYGHGFRYEEGVLAPFGAWGFPLAGALSAGTAVVGAVASIGTLRRALARLLPQPGQGPSRETRVMGRRRACSARRPCVWPETPSTRPAACLRPRRPWGMRCSSGCPFTPA